MFFIFNGKNVIWGVIFAVVGLSIGATASVSLYKKVFTDKQTPCVIVDAGHGIPDGGAVGKNGTIEQKINLDIAKKLCEVLKGRGMKVIMTRTNENSLFTDGSLRDMKVKDMRKRFEIMKKSNADLFISIHMNFFPSESVHGLRVFYDPSHEEIRPLAEAVQDEMSRLTGAKTAEVKPAEGSLFLMKNTPIPAILAECGFLSNEEEERKLNDEEYQSKIAWAIARATEIYFSSN